jgi:hypothetical protein
MVDFLESTIDLMELQRLSAGEIEAFIKLSTVGQILILNHISWRTRVLSKNRREKMKEGSIIDFTQKRKIIKHMNIGRVFIGYVVLFSHRSIM